MRGFTYNTSFKMCAYRYRDDSLREPDQHVVPGTHNIPSPAEQLRIFRDNGCGVLSELENEYLDIGNRDQEDIDVVETPQIESNRVPKRKVIEVSYTGPVQEEWNVVEKLLFSSHAPRISLCFAMIQQPKKGGHDGRSKKELNEHVPDTFLLIHRDDCCPVVNIDISEASNDQGDGPVD